jgi:ribonuclease P protein component
VDKNSAPILGTAIPKRYARAAVMRNVLKRLIRYVATRHAAALGSGVWLVRLLAPFSRTEFRSADSARLRQAVLQELDRLFSGALAVSQHPVRP